MTTALGAANDHAHQIHNHVMSYNQLVDEYELDHLQQPAWLPSSMQHHCLEVKALYMDAKDKWWVELWQELWNSNWTLSVTAGDGLCHMSHLSWLHDEF